MTLIFFPVDWILTFLH